MKKRFLGLFLTFLMFSGICSDAFSRIDPAAKNYYHKGIENFKKSNYAEALTDFTEAIKIFPQYEMALLNRAYTHEKLGNSFQAIEDYNQVVKINNKNKEAFYSRGHLNSRIGLDDEAIKDYTKVIELDVKSYNAHYERGLIYSIMGLYPEALNDFEKCSHIKPGAEIDYITGVVESKLGNEDKAIVFFTTAIKFDKNNKNYYFHRADSKIKLGKYSEAMEDLLIANSMDSAKTDAYVYHSMGIAQHYMRNYNEALVNFNKAIDLNPIVNDFYYHRAGTCMNLKMYDKAIADYTMVIELDPQGLDPYINRAVAYTALGKYPEAEGDYSKYIEINPYNFFIYQKRADVRVSMKNMEGALSDLNALIELKPENASAYFNRGMLEIKLDKKDDACKDFKKSGELGNPEVAELVKKSCQ
jgi:tetratricopeptide (TPR) repeat protein